VSGKSRSGAAASGIVPYELVLMPLLFWRGTDIRMKKVAGMFGLSNKPIYICSTD
jgi:hypothetical protein